MKNILVFLVIATMASCSGTKVTQAWVKENCTETHSIDAQGESYVYVKCSNLYPTEKVKKLCKKANICYYASDATIEVEASCGDSTTNIAQIIRAILNKK